MASSIVDTLKRFNRKERYWVVQTALAPPSLELSAGFCKQINDKLPSLSEPITPKTWWSIDYHLDWLYAALCWHAGGPWPDGHTAQENGLPDDGKSRIIKGQQEDIDFIVATAHDIVLIEAKAFESWSNEQLKCKARRLALFDADDDGRVPKAARLNATADQPPRLHFLLMSRRGQKLIDPKIKWPNWVELDGGVPKHLSLDVELATENVLAVSRCDSDGENDKTGAFWIVRGR